VSRFVRRQAERGSVAAVRVRVRDGAAFIPLALAPDCAPVSGDIRIELRRGPIAR
jgi:hypothetical protein